MNWKMALAVSALAGVGGAFAALGCGSDECTRADDHFADCYDNLGLSTSSSSSSGQGPSESCAGSRLCHSQCINKYSCPQITSNDSVYTECIAACNEQ